MTTDNFITFGPNGTLFSPQFDDIYFDAASGCQQSQTVFIDANNIALRLRQEHDIFTIGETGFGTGLNFLLALRTYAQLQRQLQKDCAHQPPDNSLCQLNFISVEKYPLNKAQLIASLATVPELSDYAALLIAQYPDDPGQPCTLEFFQGKVKLQLLVADATQGFAQLTAPKTGLVDAWFLDGFAPAKNPAMWSEGLCTQLARLAKNQATFSTFTVAGMVRRHLTAVGFRVEKKAVSGNKSEMLSGVYQFNLLAGKGYQLRTISNKPQQVSIIGGGIASACAAYALTKNGIKVTLYCQDSEIAQGASSNAIGALFPLLHQQPDPISRFYQQAFWHAKACYQQLLDDGFYFSHDWCGLLDVAYKQALKTRQQHFETINAWPKALIHGVDAQQASNLAGVPIADGGLFMPNSGWIAPAELVKQLFAAANKTNRLRIKTNIKVEQLCQHADRSWQLHTNKGIFNDPAVIVCGGADAIKLNIIEQLPLASVRGQVSSMRSDEKLSALATVICHKGYLTPAHHAQHCIGATFTKNSVDTIATIEDDAYNLNMLHDCLPELTHWTIDDVIGSKARLRCASPDHLPLVGPMPDIAQHRQSYSHLATDKNWRYHEATPVINNLYVLTGLGARGLCSAPLLADILVADLCGTPYPVDSEMLFNLAPNRFVIRDIIRRKN